MKELEYPFNGESIIKKKKSIKKALLERENVNYIEKKIAVLGGSTTKVFVEILDLFLLNQGINYNRHPRLLPTCVHAFLADKSTWSFLWRTSLFPLSVYLAQVELNYPQLQGWTHVPGLNHGSE